MARNCLHRRLSDGASRVWTLSGLIDSCGHSRTNRSSDCPFYESRGWSYWVPHLNECTAYAPMITGYMLQWCLNHCCKGGRLRILRVLHRTLSLGVLSLLSLMCTILVWTYGSVPYSRFCLFQQGLVALNDIGVVCEFCSRLYCLVCYSLFPNGYEFPVDYKLEA